MHIGERTKKIGELHSSGVSISELSERYSISESSVKKRVKSYERHKSDYYNTTPKQKSAPYNKPEIPRELYWPLERIKKGFDLFIEENDRLPTATEIDDYKYLPSSRSIQRSHGGLVKVRKALGYDEHDFGRGKHRAAIAKRINIRGNQAEDELEKILVERFGEVYVHAQKGYGSGQSRFDFVVYADSATLGVDVFVSGSKANIQKNIQMKLKKYISASAKVQNFFVVFPVDDEKLDMKSITQNMKTLNESNTRVLFQNDFIKLVDEYSRLESPINYISLLGNQ